MRNFTLTATFIFLLLSTIQVSAQYGRYNSRHYGRSYHYPVRSSVSVIASLPFGAVALNFGNYSYHYYKGYYYRPYSRGYTIVRPPVGIIVPNLPYGSVRIHIGTRSYYRFNGVFYIPFGKRYKVVDQPKEEESTMQKNDVDIDDAGYEKVIIEGKTYYKKDEKYYKASVTEDGEVVYKEVGGIEKS